MVKRKIGLPKRKKKVSRVREKVGAAPGTVSYLGTKEKSESLVFVTTYDSEEVETKEHKRLEDILQYQKDPRTSWINVIGITDVRFIEELGQGFALNNLLLEDAVDTDQRAKIDEYDGYIFGVFKMLYLNENDEIVPEHMAMVLMANSVLVFQEVKDDVFNGVRNRINSKSGRIRSRGADYLFFALLDAIIDNYFLVLEQINHRIELLEDEVYADPKPEVAHQIQLLKKEVLKIRRWIFPVKELVSRLIDSESPLIKHDTKLFLRDALDHSLEINETLQIYREMSMSLMEMYMSNMSNKMNEVMKVLTIMASIFIPLTFIAGIYGMNFEHMPELQYKYGYYVVWAVMVLLFIGMMVYFKRKDWL
ncbi:magnesium and cobalt transport protein CorA [Maribacter algicola]|uniref:Magnesium transport protein CorA n=1 Tax=Maribacter algicola TaxID=2498892 RepID=A0A3R8PWY9_9FLAO|nr:magnesium/cobalt transporter CorA [Maribacter algicola]RRQ48311.1 magnesium and cobalt transport protein CorA [Maribacter algicola]